MKMLFNPIAFFQQQLQMLFKKGTLLEKLIFFFYFFSSVGLLLYSYTQIDLGLVITRIPRLYAIEKLFQHIGYFERPLSTEIFICISAIFLVLYFYFWRFTSQQKIHSYTIWSVVGVVTLILTFSYNTFSYDFFNYIFDAKILTHYHQNPYLHKALDYPKDPMLGFMHWTDRTYPYGPLWLVITVIISFISVNIFILTFFLFKILVSVSFLFTIYYLYQILANFNKATLLQNLVLFCFNPVVLYECLVSAHNDIVMMAFACAALYYLTRSKYWLSIFLLIVSIGIKFATAALIPVFILILFEKQIGNPVREKIYQLCFAFMLFPLLFVTSRTIFQPWYLLYILPFIPLIVNRFIRLSFMFISSLGIFLYIPFLATGDWHSFWYTFPEKVVYWAILTGAILSGFYVLYAFSRLLNFKVAFNK
jgi:hypothetical protein